MSFVSNTTTSTDTQYNLLNQWSTNQTGGADKTGGAGKSDKVGGTGATGAGSIAGTQDGPDAAAPTALTAMMASISEMMPKMTGEQLDVLITSFTTKLKDTIDKSDKDQITNEQGVKREQIAEKTKKYKEAQEKIEEAKHAMEHASFFDKLKLAMQYIGAIMSIIAGIAAIIAGVALAETGVGLAAGIIGGTCLIASGVIMLTMAADSTVAMETAKDGQGGMFGHMIHSIAKAEGKSDEEANEMAHKGAMGISIGLMVLACVTGVVGGALNPEGEVSAIIDVVSEAMNMVTMAVSTTSEVGSAVYNKEAQDDQADAKNMQADGKRMEALGKVLDDFIDMAIARLKASGDRFAAVIDSVTDAMKDRADTMSRAQFKA